MNVMPDVQEGFEMDPLKNTVSNNHQRLGRTVVVAYDVKPGSPQSFSPRSYGQIHISMVGTTVSNKRKIPEVFKTVRLK